MTEHRVPHVSASQITTFRDCPRKWYLNKIVGLQSPSTSATELGSQVHATLEAYLRGETGVIGTEDEIGEIARSGAEHLPEVGDHLEIELSLEEHMPLLDAPVLVKGFVDLIDHSKDEIVDHKTSSNKRYTKSQRELAINVQLMMYAEAYFQRFPNKEKVTLTHIYYGTKSRWSKRVSVTVTREHVRDQWTQIKETINQMMQASCAPDASEVHAEYDSCAKYGGCPFRGACFNAHNQTPKGTQPPPREETTKMSGMTREERLARLTGGSTQPTPKKAPKRTAKVLYIGCVPMKGANTFPVSATEALAPMIQELCESFNVPHLAVVDYGKGWSALSATLVDRGWPANVSTIYLDPISKEYECLVSVLTDLADVVVKRG
jgi:CRISPR/Cas system-associated exonuclease Cas4 (RecB family)